MALDPKMPVLVVDDYSTMVRIIRNLLRQLGFVDIDDATDGAAALEKMNSKRYGLVISDWNMEPMTDRLRPVAAGARQSSVGDDAVHHGDGGIQDRERDRSEKGRREQLHCQAV